MNWLSIRSRGTAAAAMLAIALAGSACNDKEKEPGTDSKTQAEAGEAVPSGMLVGPENITVVKTTEIRTGPSISGTLEPEEQATVRAEVGGAVLSTSVEQGDRVSKGQTIARIDDSAVRDQVLSARSLVTTAQNSVDVAQRQVTRSEALLKAGAIAERDVELAHNQLTATQAQLADARARLANAQKQQDKTTILAPFSGVVSARQLSAGDVVQPGGAVYTIVNPATMRLEASVPADQLASVRQGAVVNFSVNGYPGRRFTGRVTRINPIADPTTRQVRLIISLPNQGGVLVGGLFADGQVSSETHMSSVVPAAAVDERGVRPFVMRIKGGRVQKAEVELGIRDAASETVEIRSGLMPGDTILLGAARGISAGTPVKVSAPADSKAP